MGSGVLWLSNILNLGLPPQNFTRTPQAIQHRTEGERDKVAGGEGRKSRKHTNKKRMDRQDPKTNGESNTQQTRTSRETHTLPNRKKREKEE